MATHQAWVLVAAVQFGHYFSPSASTSDFCYTDPDCGPYNWGGKCQTGTRQSPINIPFIVDILPPRVVQFSTCLYQEHDFLLENVGTLVRLQFLNPGEKCIASGTLLGGRYKFAKMEFHWGSNNSVGSEHTVNEARYPMEVQLFYYLAKYKSYAAAVASGRHHAVTIFQVLCKVSTEDDSAFGPIYNKLGDVTRAGSSTTGKGFIPASFIPPTCGWMVTPVAQYDGSLTTPECEEGIQWNIFLDTISISQKQLDAFRTLMDTKGHALVDNYRPIQELNGRTVDFWSVSCPKKR